MVARPELSVIVAPMELADVASVEAIELASFSAPWPPNAYRTELQANRLAHYMVIRVGSRIVGYAGLWLMVDEAHVTTFAIHPDWRRRRLGERLLIALLDAAIERRAAEATLEVRLSNLAARRLYEKFGFRPVGIRPRYYTDNDEDALIMTTERLDGPVMGERLARLRALIEAAPGSIDGPIPADPAAAEESAADVASGPQPPPAGLSPPPGPDSLL
jgi:[ribosomal protein S18]-alanine N-acetyltransferase